VKAKREKDNKKQHIPMHRIRQPCEIAKVALFLATDDAIILQG
jgi:NAD(P)-dependent dehydrogenase (short-subunit alcohol dehydrogenase family)